MLLFALIITVAGGVLYIVSSLVLFCEPKSSPTQSMINDLCFNQDATCVSVATSTGYSIFNCDPFGEFYSSKGSVRGPKNSGSTSNDFDNGADSSSGASSTSPTASVKLLFSTSLTIIIPQLGQPFGDRLMRIFNLKQGLKICELTFPVGIVGVRLNRKRLCVLLSSGQLFIYDLGCVRLVKVLELDPDHSFVGDLAPDDCSYLVLPMSSVTKQTDLFNLTSAGTDAEPNGDSNSNRPTPQLADLIDITSKNQSDKLKHPGLTLEEIHKDSPGWIMVYDTLELRPRLIFKAHDSPLAKIRVSNDGSSIATALTKGTIVRVSWVAKNGDDLHLHQVTNLRRGHQPTKIASLAFSADGTVLGCGSKSGTVHLFSIGKSPMSGSSSNGDGTEGDPDSESEGSSSDLNDNLNSLLLTKPDQEEKENDENLYTHLKTLGKSSKLINNHYTKTFMKKLPYKDYLENLIWEPPRRSFAFVKLAEHKPDGAHMEIGITNQFVFLASYLTGTLYQYRIPAEVDDQNRIECQLVNRYSMWKDQ